MRTAPKCRVCEGAISRGHFLCEVPAEAKSKVNKAATVVRRAGTSATKDDLAALWLAQDDALAELASRNRVQDAAFAGDPDDAADEIFFRKNHDVICMNCEASPTVGDEELCGPCFFGDASTAGGEW